MLKLDIVFLPMSTIVESGSKSESFHESSESCQESSESEKSDDSMLSLKKSVIGFIVFWKIIVINNFQGSV